MQQINQPGGVTAAFMQNIMNPTLQEIYDEAKLLSESAWATNPADLENKKRDLLVRAMPYAADSGYDEVTGFINNIV